MRAGLRCLKGAASPGPAPGRGAALTDGRSCRGGGGVAEAPCSARLQPPGPPGLGCPGTARSGAGPAGRRVRDGGRCRSGGGHPTAGLAGNGERPPGGSAVSRVGGCPGSPASPGRLSGRGPARPRLRRLGFFPCNAPRGAAPRAAAPLLGPPPGRYQDKRSARSCPAAAASHGRCPPVPPGQITDTHQ